MGGDVTALRQAQCFLKASKDRTFKDGSGPLQVKNQKQFVINDMTLPSGIPRLFLVNLETGRVELFKSAHGIGKGRQKNSGGVAEAFSNTPNSLLSPEGFLLIGGRHQSARGAAWGYGLQLHGLQKINDKSYERAILLHQALKREDGKVVPYVKPGYVDSSVTGPQTIDETGDSGFSQGCVAVNPTAWPALEKMTGAVVYNYTPAMKKKGDSYCGE